MTTEPVYGQTTVHNGSFFGRHWVDRINWDGISVRISMETGSATSHRIGLISTTGAGGISTGVAAAKSHSPPAAYNRPRASLILGMSPFAGMVGGKYVDIFVFLQNVGC